MLKQALTTAQSVKHIATVTARAAFDAAAAEDWDTASRLAGEALEEDEPKDTRLANEILAYVTEALIARAYDDAQLACALLTDAQTAHEELVAYSWGEIEI